MWGFKYLPPWEDLKFALLAFILIIIGGYILEGRHSYYRIEYTQSDRSKCKRCGELINKGSLRIGTSCDEVGYGKWQHIRCLSPDTQQHIIESFGGENIFKLNGYKELNNHDQIKIKKLMNKVLVKAS